MMPFPVDNSSMKSSPHSPTLWYPNLCVLGVYVQRSCSEQGRGLGRFLVAVAGRFSLSFTHWDTLKLVHLQLQSLGYIYYLAQTITTDDDEKKKEDDDVDEMYVMMIMMIICMPSSSSSSFLIISIK